MRGSQFVIIQTTSCVRVRAGLSRTLISFSLEETNNFSSGEVNVDIIESWASGQARDGHNIAADGIHESKHQGVRR
jgi:hypothetical protein